MASYATVIELAAMMQLDGHVAVTTVLQSWLDAATQSIDQFCNRAADGFVAAAAASARYFTGKGEPHLLIDECVEITGIAVKDSATDTAYAVWTAPTTAMAGDGDWIPFAGSPSRPYFGRLPYTAVMTDINGNYAVFISGKFAHRGGFRPSTTICRNVPTVKITAKWGYAVIVPPVIKNACMFQAARWYKRGTAGGADAIASGELGMLLYTKALDPAIQMLLVEGRMVRPLYGD
jgi:hypothetical protein